MGAGGDRAERSTFDQMPTVSPARPRQKPAQRRAAAANAGAHGGSVHLSLVDGDDRSSLPTEGRVPAQRSPLVRARRRRFVLALADVATIVVSLCVALVLLGSPRPAAADITVVLEVGALAAVWMSALVANRLYLARCVERTGEEIRRILVSGAVAIAGYLIGCYLVGAAPADRAWVTGVFAGVSMALVAERSVARHIFHMLRRRGRSVRRIAIIGSDDHALALQSSLIDDTDVYEVVGLIGDQNVLPGDVRVLGGYDRAVDILREHDCSGAIVSLASLTRPQVNAVVRSLSDAKMHVALSTSMRDIDVHRLRAQELDGEVMMYVEPSVRTGWRMYAKRTFDVVVASVALLLCSPVLAVVAVLIKLDSPGPVLFRQERVGRDGTPFDMIKLRTMCVDAEAKLDELSGSNEANGPLFKIEADPRITRLGRFLRRFSIDEFPQFWNVIRGEMSLVGPRPALEREVAEWDPELRKRLEVPPGLSGLWQVSGRSDTTFEQYRRLDLYYVDNWSFAHDLRVIVKTVWVVLTMKGAS